MKPYVVAITGASGVVYGVRLVQVLAEQGCEIFLVISKNARLVLEEELGFALQDLSSSEMVSKIFAPPSCSRIRAFSPNDFLAPIASGSFPVEAMTIIPCSMGTVGALAGGMSQNLIHRAADCCIKEGRRLVIVPRETPLSSLHLENLLKLSHAGVRIVPAMPGFYAGVTSLHEMVDFVVGKVLDQMNVVHALFQRWTGTQTSLERGSHGRIV